MQPIKEFVGKAYNYGFVAVKKIRSEEGILLRKEGLVEFLSILIPDLPIWFNFLKPEKCGEKDREKVFFAFFADFLLSKAKKTMKKR